MAYYLVEYRLNASIGIRASYYLGLADVVKDLDSNYNYKNTSVGINLLFY